MTTWSLSKLYNWFYVYAQKVIDNTVYMQIKLREVFGYKKMDCVHRPTQSLLWIIISVGDCCRKFYYCYSYNYTIISEIVKILL